MAKKYKMRVVRGAFVDSVLLDNLGARTIEQLDRDEWQSIDVVGVDLKQIKELQKGMVRHFDDPDIPWYMDGKAIDNNDEIIVAFGADDGEGGKIFIFDKGDLKALKKVIDYGVSKGIPKEQLDFMDIKI